MDPIVLSSTNQIIVFVILGILETLLLSSIIQSFWNDILVKKCPGLALEEISIGDALGVFVIINFLRDGLQYTLARRIASTV